MYRPPGVPLDEWRAAQALARLGRQEMICRASGVTVLLADEVYYDQLQDDLATFLAGPMNARDRARMSR